MQTRLASWRTCFERRAAHPAAIPDTVEDSLSLDERARIARSLAVFQLGEQSDGRHLLLLARQFAVEQRCPDLVRITECFIREEQRHAATLASYMAAHGLPTLQHDWSNDAFRRLRRLGGFEFAVSVLITAELIGIQYYRALLRSTGSRRLRTTCSLLLQDEALHVAYGSDLLLALRSRRSAAAAGLLRVAHSVFHVATSCLVWWQHRQVLRSAGYGFREFAGTCSRHYSLYFRPPRSRAGRGQRPINRPNHGREAS